MLVYIVGHLGNMAARYKRILETYGYQWVGTDVAESTGFYDYVSPATKADAVIVATPTDTHFQILWNLSACGKPILCEKPITKNLDELDSLLTHMRLANTRLQMVSQYDFLIDDVSEGLTSYDYFRHGSDGLYFDCINILKHARGKVELRESSPVWRCQINGQNINPGLMDLAYVEMLCDWLKNLDRPTDFDAIWTAHKKVADLEAEARKCMS